MGGCGRRTSRNAAAERAESLFKARQDGDERVRSLKRSGGTSRAERLARARFFLEVGLPTDAFNEATRLLVSEPRDGEAQVLLGEVCLSLAPPAVGRAAEAFRRALRAKPNDPDAMAGFAETHRLEGRPKQAAAMFRSALAAAPAHVAAGVGLARASLDLGDPAAAIERLEDILRTEPQEDAALRALAEIYASDGPSGRPGEALALLDRAEDLYGRETDIRVRALVLLGEEQRARELLEESPFLATAAREALARDLDD